LSYHLGMYFSTKDRDNDASGKRDCADLERGGWWYKDCSKVNLNGLYLYGDASHLPGHFKWQGITWYTWKGYEYSFAAVKMMIREYGADVDK